MKIQNSFRLGLFGGLGVLVAMAIGTAIGTLATILTYIGAAIFLALGLDPLVSWLERKGLPRWAAVLIVVFGVLLVFAGLVLAVVPVIVEQSANLVTAIAPLIPALGNLEWVEDLSARLPDYIDLHAIIAGILDWVRANLSNIGGGVLQVGLGIASGLFGALIVVILTIYFISSLNGMKRGLYRMVPASRRARFADISEQVSGAVGRYVVGQVSLASVNGILSFVYLTIIQASYPALYAFIAFLFSLIPLVGSLTGSTVITLSCLLFDGVPTAIAAGIYYLIYMQIEAYVLNPLIMRKAVKVPGWVVMIAALSGGALLGVLGALIAIPVAASVLLIIDQVFLPRQQEL